MPTTPLRVLCVHGVNTPETDTRWQDGWKQAIEVGVARWDPGRKVELVFARYNDLFRGTPLGPLDYVKALARLLGSGQTYESPGSSRRRGPYPKREPWSSHFFIWLPNRNPVRTHSSRTHPSLMSKPTGPTTAPPRFHPLGSTCPPRAPQASFHGLTMI